MTIRYDILARTVRWLSAAWATLAMVPAGESAIGGSEPSYSDTELKSFAAAAIHVQRINDAYVPKMKDAKSAQEKEELGQMAAGEMVQAVKNEGFTLDAYENMAIRVQTDPDLARRVKQKIMDVK